MVVGRKYRVVADDILRKLERQAQQAERRLEEAYRALGAATAEAKEAHQIYKDARCRYHGHVQPESTKFQEFTGYFCARCHRTVTHSTIEEAERRVNGNQP